MKTYNKISVNPKLSKLIQEQPQRNVLVKSFKSNPYPYPVKITFLKVMIQLPNFGYMTTSTI